MSTVALALKKQQAADYFAYHPDSQDIEIVGSDDTFPGLFDLAYKDGDKDSGNVMQLRRQPRVQFYSGYADLITGGTTQIIVNDKTYNVITVRVADSNFQGELWLA